MSACIDFNGSCTYAIAQGVSLTINWWARAFLSGDCHWTIEESEEDPGIWLDGGILLDALGVNWPSRELELIIQAEASHREIKAVCQQELDRMIHWTAEVAASREGRGGSSIQ